MRFMRIVPVVLAGALLAGCAPDAEEADAGSESPAVQPGTPSGAEAPAEARQLDGCYLTATREEAAERPSPLGETTIALGGEEATFCYGRPSVRGRPVVGQLIPLGSPWRMGANEATAIHLPFAAEIGDVRVEPGSYSLYLVASEDDWTVVVNRNAERWGIPINDEVQAADVGSFERPVAGTSEPVETLTFTWEPGSGDSGNLVMEWDTLRMEIPIRRVEG